MCTGIEIAGMAAMLGGTGLGMYASSEEQAAMNSAAAKEMARQAEYSKQGKAAFSDSLNRSTPESVKGNMEGGALTAAREYNLMQQNQPQGSALTQASLAGGPVNSSAATEDQLINSRVGQSNAANAVLQGYNTNTVQQGINDSEVESKLRQIGNFSSQSAAILPMELQSAASSQSALHGIGSLLSTAGGLAGLYGALSGPAVAGIDAGAGSLASTPSVVGPLASGSMPAWGGAVAPTAANMGFGTSFAPMYAAQFPVMSASQFGGGLSGLVAQNAWPTVGSLASKDPSIWGGLMSKAGVMQGFPGW